MISPFAKNSANWFVSLKDNTFFFLYLSPLLPKQFHKLREHLENIEKEKKIMLIFSILFQCFFHFLSWKLFLCSQNYNVYRFLYFYTAWRKWKHQKGRWWLFQILKILPRGRHDRLVLCKFKVSIRGRDNIHLAYYREKVSFSCHCQINGTWWACKREELECEPKVMSLHLGESTILRFYNLKSLSDTLLGTFHLCIVFIIIIPLT